MDIYLSYMLDKWFLEKLNRRKEKSLLRKLKVSNNMVDLSSNDYLGLANNRELGERIHQKLANLPNGATGSRLLSGNSLLHEQTESFLANFFQSESSLIYSSGYMANLGVLSAIPQRGDTIVYDELSHSSIKDGIRLSNADIKRFKHNNSEDLERILSKSSGRIFVVVESIYSMDGDFCDFDSIMPIIRNYKAELIVDEAHSTGLYGNGGEGVVVEKGLEKEVSIRIHTFGKAMGIHGACVVGSNLLRDYLINFSRPFIYTTAVPPSQLASIYEAFLYLKENPHLREELHSNIGYFIEKKNGSDAFLSSSSSIQGILVKGNTECRRVSNIFRDNNFDVFPVLSPTVQQGKERIRICLHNYNTRDEMDRFFSIIKKEI